MYTLMYSFLWSMCIFELGRQFLAFWVLETRPEEPLLDEDWKLEEPITEPLGMAQLSGAIHRATKPIKHASVFD